MLKSKFGRYPCIFHLFALHSHHLFIFWKGLDLIYTKVNSYIWLAGSGEMSTLLNVLFGTPMVTCWSVVLFIHDFAKDESIDEKNAPRKHKWLLRLLLVCYLPACLLLFCLYPHVHACAVYYLGKGLCSYLGWKENVCRSNILSNLNLQRCIILIFFWRGVVSGLTHSQSYSPKGDSQSSELSFFPSILMAHTTKLYFL